MIEHNIERVVIANAKHLKKETLEDIKEYISCTNCMLGDKFGYIPMYTMANDSIWIKVPGNRHDPKPFETISSQIEKISDNYKDLLDVLILASHNECDWLCINDEAKTIPSMPTYW